MRLCLWGRRGGSCPWLWSADARRDSPNKSRRDWGACGWRVTQLGSPVLCPPARTSFCVACSGLTWGVCALVSWRHQVLCVYRSCKNKKKTKPFREEKAFNISLRTPATGCGDLQEAHSPREALRCRGYAAHLTGRDTWGHVTGVLSAENTGLWRQTLTSSSPGPTSCRGHCLTPGHTDW